MNQFEIRTREIAAEHLSSKGEESTAEAVLACKLYLECAENVLESNLDIYAHENRNAKLQCRTLYDVTIVGSRPSIAILSRECTSITNALQRAFLQTSNAVANLHIRAI